MFLVLLCLAFESLSWCQQVQAELAFSEMLTWIHERVGLGSLKRTHSINVKQFQTFSIPGILALRCPEDFCGYRWKTPRNDT